MTENYSGCYEYLSAQFEQVGGYEFYREIFPDNENSGEHNEDYSKPNAVYLYYDEEKDKLRQRVMLNDTWEQDYIDYVERNQMTLCGGLAYCGGVNRLALAQRMNALIFDLDGVGYNELRSLFLRFGGEPQELRRLPMPSFLVLSGNGLHVYYVFEEPVDLYPNIKIQMKSLKYDLTFRMWDYKGTSQLKTIQYQSINQGFRMVGSINQKYGTEIIAFRTGGRVTLNYLNAYARPENRVDINRPFHPSRMTRAEAREKYPEWYQRVVVNGKRGQKKWDIAGKVHGDDPLALYHWWLRQVDLVVGGHRYFYLMCLAIYAYKCDVPKQELQRDMQTAFEKLQAVDHINELTKDDVRSALEAYDREYFNFTVADIEKLTSIRIDRNKRNGRKQEQHLKIARATRDIVNADWRKGNGRPSAQRVVYEWRELHPDGRKIDCERETGLSRHTVLKWWDNPPAVRYADGGLTVKVRPSPELSDLLVDSFKGRP